MRAACYFATTPLDILACMLIGIVFFTGVLVLVMAGALVSDYVPINFERNIEGYNLLITEKTPYKRGYGVMCGNGIQIWEYHSMRDGRKSEVRLFHAFPLKSGLSGAPAV